MDVNFWGNSIKTNIPSFIYLFIYVIFPPNTSPSFPKGGLNVTLLLHCSMEACCQAILDELG
jgi:hypothetical protein